MRPRGDAAGRRLLRRPGHLYWDARTQARALHQRSSWALFFVASRHHRAKLNIDSFANRQTPPSSHGMKKTADDVGLTNASSRNEGKLADKLGGRCENRQPQRHDEFVGHQLSPQRRAMEYLLRLTFLNFFGKNRIY